MYELEALLAESVEGKNKALRAFKSSLSPYIEREQAKQSKDVADRLNRYMQMGQWVLDIGATK